MHLVRFGGFSFSTMCESITVLSRTKTSRRFTQIVPRFFFLFPSPPSPTGGPFGSEPSLKAAGNLYAIIGFAVMPIVWSLPEAVMTYEMSTLFPCASGGVRFVRDNDDALLCVAVMLALLHVLCFTSFLIMTISVFDNV